MTSYEFEVAAKNAVIKEVEANYHEKLKIQEINTVWFAYILQNMKTILMDCRRDNQRIYEVTYNPLKKEMYIDIYDKYINAKYSQSQINTKVED